MLSPVNGANFSAVAAALRRMDYHLLPPVMEAIREHPHQQLADPLLDLLQRDIHREWQAWISQPKYRWVASFRTYTDSDGDEPWLYREWEIDRRDDELWWPHWVNGLSHASLDIHSSTLSELEQVAVNVEDFIALGMLDHACEEVISYWEELLEDDYWGFDPERLIQTVSVILDAIDDWQHDEHDADEERFAPRPDATADLNGILTGCLEIIVNTHETTCFTPADRRFSRAARAGRELRPNSRKAPFSCLWGDMDERCWRTFVGIVVEVQMSAVQAIGSLADADLVRRLEMLELPFWATAYSVRREITALVDLVRLICPFCRSPLGLNQNSLVTCPSCSTRHHTECWVENGGCTRWGCHETPLRPTTDDEEDALTADEDECDDDWGWDDDEERDWYEAGDQDDEPEIELLDEQAFLQRLGLHDRQTGG